MDSLLWTAIRGDGVDIVSALWRPFLITLVLYYSGYLGVWLQSLLRIAGIGRFRPLTREEAVDILVVIPTLLRKAEEVAELEEAAATVRGNHYPGRCTLVIAIDGARDRPDLVDELERWANTTDDVLVARVEERAGKGVAVVAGLDRAEQAVRDGKLSALPSIFFNMDADSVLGAQALERMVAQLVRRSPITRRRATIVASNVLVRREHYWHGWRAFFTMRSQLALQVAREYMTSISISRNNMGLLPVTGVSGALYATYTQLHVEQARYASFLQTVRWGHFVRWCLGAAPPSFRDFTGAPNVRATAGPGDDTWIAWLAMSVQWRGDTLDLELPRTPLHAFWRLLRSFIQRPIAYDPHARVFTATPTTVRALYKQRVRWNNSRLWLAARFKRIPWFHWELGLWVLSDVVLTLVIHAMILTALLGWPFSSRPAAWFSLVVLGYIATFVTRAAATLLAILQEESLREHWHKLLALPLSGVFHFVFNISTTIVGVVEDVFLFGSNTGFAPEETLEASHTARIALAYRLRRCARMMWRAVRHGDIPPGFWWLGWHATRYTPSGYYGWTNPKHRR